MKKKKILLLGKYFKKNLNNSLYTFLYKSFDITTVKEFEDFKLNEYDFIFVYGYGKVLNSFQIKKLKGKIINLHIGFLPYGRGIYPLLWSIIFSKPVGFTIHLIVNEKIDDGPIIIRKKIDYKLNSNLKQIHLKCRKQMEKYFIKNFSKIIKFDSKKANNIKKLKEKFYFSRKISNKLIHRLPKKWGTSINYLTKNSKIFKQIYKI